MYQIYRDENIGNESPFKNLRYGYQIMCSKYL